MTQRVAGVPAKKAYCPPKLTFYGDLTELTLTKPKGTGQFDNKKKTKRT